MLMLFAYFYFYGGDVGFAPLFSSDFLGADCDVFDFNVFQEYASKQFDGVDCSADRPSPCLYYDLV